MRELTMKKAKAQERTLGQPQATKFFNIVGRAKKQTDGIQCHKCHSVIVPSGSGIADLSGTVNGLGFICEVKDGWDRFNFAERDAEQRQYAHEWEYDTGGISLVWLLMGADKAGSTKTDFPRQTFLLPSFQLERVEYLINKWAGIKNLPLNALAADTRIATRKHRLYATRLLASYSMQWAGGGLWWPGDDHSFWDWFSLSPRKLRHLAKGA